ncbi:MAG: His/Gly/Thr/Pro-type tRNA ligase C-terminal domain-containing protein, partial [Steroidobacteraceae bacterium]
AERLRETLPGAGVQVNMGGGSLKSQMKRADKSGATLALIIGDDEIARESAAVRILRGDANQQDCPLNELAGRVASMLGGKSNSRSDDGR